MKSIVFSTIGSSPALVHARNYLATWGYQVVPNLDPAVTHILLPVPSLDNNLHIPGGPSLEDLIRKVPADCTIMGGFLPELPHKTVDFLKDEYYTAENAAITAQCALAIAIQKISKTLKDTNILIIGWGRIGKCLSDMLRSIGAKTTVAVRNQKDEAILSALGYHSIQINKICPENYSLIFNTVPAPILDITSPLNNTIILDLASKRGITGAQVLWEKGLPGRIAPESSGLLVAKTALRYALRKE